MCNHEAENENILNTTIIVKPLKTVVNDKELLIHDYKDSTGEYKKYKEDNPGFFIK